jgi:hypothetical protein
MLATVAALHVFVLAQVSAAPPVAADDASRPLAEAPPAPQLPPPAEPGPEAAPPSAEAPPAEVPAEGRKPERVEPGRPRQQSLLSGEGLRGGSAALAWAGWPELGAIYAIGFTERDDGGAFLSYDWAKTETRLGVFYRRPLGLAGPFDLAARLSLAYYSNFGARYFYDENHSDRGFEVNPGVSLSRRVASGIFSVLGEAPMIFTGKYDFGFLFTPRASFAFETLLYPEVTVGALIGIGYRAGAGDAPLDDGRGEVRFLVLAGYQLL